MMKRHFVVFYSPGTLFAEQSERPVASWDIEAAKKMARDIKARHGATPYGFRFVTRGRTDEELDSRTIKHSPMYFLGGKVKTLKQLKAENSPQNKQLISNMEFNRYNRVVTNDNSWRWTQQLEKGDVVLSWP
jgi:hypothetical protein